MNSSPDAGKVLLPTFEEMMCLVDGPTRQGEEPQDEPAAQEGAADSEKAGETPAPCEGKKGAKPEDKLAQAEALCEEMRRKAAEEARQILEEARKDAADIARQTKEQEQARARTEQEREMSRLRTSVLDAAKALKNSRDALYTALEPYLLDTAIRIAEGILKYELAEKNQAFLSIVHNVLSQAAAGQAAVLHLHPSRFAELAGSEAEPGFLAEMAERGVTVQQDPELDELDCLVTTNRGSIRGGVTSQLARIRSAAGGQHDRGVNP
ncbi:MAG: FliH/SctL family protein [Candidatus Pelethousia sp.]|nr:FliH/SctL family protein [Candidatus Pelethousia sp.]